MYFWRFSILYRVSDQEVDIVGLYRNADIKMIPCSPPLGRENCNTNLREGKKWPALDTRNVCALLSASTWPGDEPFVVWVRDHRGQKVIPIHKKRFCKSSHSLTEYTSCIIIQTLQTYLPGVTSNLQPWILLNSLSHFWEYFCIMNRMLQYLC